MFLETHILQTTLCATFGARLCSIPLGILDHLLGQLESHDRSRTSGRVTSVGGSAMHMKIPDDIGREAGIGRTQNRKAFEDLWAGNFRKRERHAHEDS